MKKLGFVLFTVVMTMFLISGCSKAQLDEFQTNDKSAPFNIFHLFDGYPALTAAWNSVPGTIGNHKMAKMMKDDIPGTADFLYILSFLMDRAGSPGLGLLDHIKATLNLTTDSSERFYGNNRVGTTYNINSFYGDNSAPTYLNNFYGFLDEITRNVGGTTPKVGESVVNMTNKILPYLLAKSDDDLQRYLEEMYMPTFYSLIDYGGTVVRLREGSYSNAQLIAAGIAVPSQILSLKVPFAFKVTLYTGDNQTGASTEYTTSRLNIPAGTASLKIEKNRADMTDLAELLAQPLAMADFPMWINTQGTADAGDDTLLTNYSSMSGGTDSGLGNMAQGMQSLLSGMIGLMNGESVDRISMYDLFSRLNTALGNTSMIERLFWNLSNYFTPGGSVYGTAIDNSNANVNNFKYNTDSGNGITGKLYSNVELSETIRQILAGASGLFLRDDRRGSMAWYDGIKSQDYPVAFAAKYAKKIYANWDQAQIKESIYDLIRYDAYGRDRTDSGSGSFSASFLEHLLYLGAIAANTGFYEKHNTAELTDPSGGVGLPTPEGYGNKHGHGAFSGFMTLNDSLFSIMSTSLGIVYAPWSIDIQVGTYELGFDTSGVNMGKDRTYRCRKPFTDIAKDTYKFQFSLNYPAQQFMSGAAVGDYGVKASGSLNGGNNNGTSLGVDGYIPYSANGVYTKDLTSWAFAWVVRACWEGEGPYYSTQGAIQNGSTYTYYRPDGSVYAIIDKSGPQWTYKYPVSAPYDGQDPDDATQRYNRYKASWKTDYYMITSRSGNNYVPTDSDGNARPDNNGEGGAPACRTYYEIYPEPVAAALGVNRECASHEEAIFRNFQWSQNEKKLVLIIPLWLELYVPGMGQLTASALYFIMEGNGVAGLAAARKFRGNGVWAKMNAGDTSDTSVQSTIPGDYRMIVLSQALSAYGLAIITSDMVLSLLQNGGAVPAAIGQNIAPMCRLGFPRSPEVTNTENGRPYRHRLLGSRKVDNDSQNTDQGFRASSTSSQGDPVWKKRNSLLPLLIGIMASLRERSWYNSSTDFRNDIAIMLEGLGGVLKPSIFFNYDCDVSGVAENTWLSRLQGGAMKNDYKKEHSKSLMPDFEVSGFISSTSDTSGTAWYGGDVTPRFFAPPSLPNLLSVLTDSDISKDRSNRAQRADGLLCQLLNYNVNQGNGRPEVTETLVTPAEPDMANINKICFGLEQLTSGMKGSKSKATLINENMSNGTISNTKQLDPSEWMFQKRPRPDNAAKYVDIDLDKMLNKLKGGDDGLDTAKGLNQFHDDPNTYVYNDGKPDWSDLTNAKNDGSLDNLHTLTHDFLIQGAQYPISENLYDIIDILYQHSPTDAQIKGLLYNLGKLMAYYDGSQLPNPKWLLQGDTGFSTLYDFLMVAIPIIDNEMALYSAGKRETKGATYRSLLKSLQNAGADGGLVQFIVDTVSINPYSSGDVLNELSLWLDSDLISGTNTVFYSTMAEMLEKMADITLYAPSEEGLYSIYDQYGYQRDEAE